MLKIYIYDTPESRAKGLIKIGESMDVERRIREQLNTASSIDSTSLDYKILYQTVALREDGVPFTDRMIHRALESKGFTNHRIHDDEGQLIKSSTEWFCINYEKVVHLIEEFKAGKSIEEIDINRFLDFKMRPEQERAVEQTQAFFNNRIKGTLEMLWNAKMRFGKTFTAYQLAKRMGLKKILVITYKPAVEDAWKTDLESHVDFKNYVFLRRESLTCIDTHLEKGLGVVAFASYQDLLGKDSDGNNIKDRHGSLFKTHWDLLIIDEFHYGTSTKKAKELIAEQIEVEKGTKAELKKLEKELYADEDEEFKEEQYSEEIEQFAKELNSNFRLFLSGTPFRAMSDGRFPQEAVFNWTYADEQRAKEKWNLDNPEQIDANPYIGLPQIRMYLYKVSKDLIEIGTQEGKDEFSLNHFFRAKNKKEFVNQEAVEKWLNLISGVIRPYELIEDEILNEVTLLPSQYPFDHEGELFDELDHTLWYLNRVDSAYALKKALESHAIFRQYHVILAAGNELGAGLDAVGPVREAIKIHRKTITLTVGKLTTGVSIPEWKGVVFLRDIASPESYFQTAFRAQTPYTNYKTGKRKDVCYIFDFSPNRSLRLLTTYSEKLSRDSYLTTSERKIAEFIRYLPVLKVVGNHMVKMNAQEVLTFDLSDVDAKGLGERFVERRNVVVNADTIHAINATPQSQERCQEIFERIKQFRKYNGATDKEMKEADVQVKNLDVNDKKIKELKTKQPNSYLEKQKQNKELNEAEKQLKSEREKIRELLRTLLSRIPIFMYLTDATEENIEQVLIKTGDNLFRKTTGITIDDFRYLVDLGLLRIDSIDGYILRFIQLENQNYSIVNTMSKDEQLSMNE